MYRIVKAFGVCFIVGLSVEQRKAHANLPDVEELPSPPFFNDEDKWVKHQVKARRILQGSPDFPLHHRSFVVCDSSQLTLEEGIENTGAESGGGMIWQFLELLGEKIQDFGEVGCPE